MLPITEDTIYLNTGWSGPMPTPIIERMVEVAKREARDGPASAKGLATTRALAGAARTALSELVGVAADDICITHSTTEGVNVILHGIDWNPGDELLTCDLEHPALNVPMGVLSERQGVGINKAHIDPGSSQSEIFNTITSAFSAKTRLVALSHIQFTCGLRFPIKEITEAAHQRGIQVLIDGAQSIGHVAVNIMELGCDYYALSGQKWLMGPEGTGALFIHPDRRLSINPLLTTNDLESERRTARHPLGRFAIASQHPALVAGLTEAVNLVLQAGIHNIERQSMDLSRYFRANVSTIGGCAILSPLDDDSSCGLVTIALEGWKPEDLVSTLEENHSIVAREVHNPDGVRFSTARFNTEEELSKVCEVISEMSSNGPPKL
jgi:L-cysteine/cystine lyase